MRRETSRNGAVLLTLLSGACVVGALWLTDAASRVGRAAAARSSEESRAILHTEDVDALRESGLLQASLQAALRTDAPTTAGEAPEDSTESFMGFVQGSVLDRMGRAVLHAKVELRDPLGSKQVTSVDASGRFRFEVQPGDYTVVVAPMPPDCGWLPPWGQERQARSLDHPELTAGFFARSVHIEEGSETQGVSLRAFQASRARGRVVDWSGVPVEGVGVRLRSMLEPGIVVDTRTDRDGLFLLEDLYPGPYSTEVRLSQALERSYRSLPKPLAQEITVPEGEEVVLSDLVLRLGDREAGS